MTLIKIRLSRLTVASLRNKILYFFFFPRLKCILPRLIFHPVIKKKGKRWKNRVGEERQRWKRTYGLCQGFCQKLSSREVKKIKKKEILLHKSLSKWNFRSAPLDFWKEYREENPGKRDRTMFTKSRRIAIHKDKQRVTFVEI